MFAASAGLFEAAHLNYGASAGLMAGNEGRLVLANMASSGGDNMNSMAQIGLADKGLALANAANGINQDVSWAMLQGNQTLLKQGFAQRQRLMQGGAIFA